MPEKRVNRSNAPKRDYRKIIQGAAIIFALSVVAFFLQPSLIAALFSPGNFMPHSHCYLERPEVIWLHGISDLLIGLAYVSISITLGILVYKASKDLPFHFMLLAFGIFIISCGFTHFMEVWTLWSPRYWLSGAIKVVTAVASVATAIILPPIVPRILDLIESAKLSAQRKIDLEKANARLKELDEIKSQTFANVSHELRTPLTLILGPVEGALNRPGLSEEERKTFEMIRSNARILLKHVNDLLDTAKLESGQMGMEYEEVDLASLVRRTASYFESLTIDRKIRFAVQTPETLMGEVDVDKFQRILINLLSNAFKFTPEGGVVTCELQKQGERVRIQVIDNGPGVPEKMREKIFERFQQGVSGSTRPFGGTGLGLSIVRDFVNLHEGRVQVESAPEGGALFLVELPLRGRTSGKTNLEAGTKSIGRNIEEILPVVETKAGRQPEDEIPLAMEGTSKSLVLVVEDNHDMRSFLQKALMNDYRVAVARNGVEGVEKVRTLKPDLVVSDYMMPDMDGKQMMSEIRHFESSVPILFLSARADEETRIDLLGNGAGDYLIKPFSVSELKVRLANLLKIHKSSLVLKKELESQEHDLVYLAEKTAEKNRQLKEREAEIVRLNLDLEKRVEKRTRELEAANQELESFSYSVSHDLRTPLRAMSRLSQILISDYSDSLDAEGKHLLGRIVANARNMTQLIDDLLTFSRMVRHSIQRQRVDMKRMFTDVVEEARLANPDWKGEIEIQDMPEAWVDLNLVRQVAVNLISNGMKFSGKQPAPRVEVGGSLGENEVVYCVKDNGVGFDMAYEKKLFNLFERLHTETEFEGTGIGLAIVHRIVTRHGGRVWARGRLGEGAEFFVAFPRKAPEQAGM